MNDSNAGGKKLSMETPTCNAVVFSSLTMTMATIARYNNPFNRSK